jgi:hypothetical protein
MGVAVHSTDALFALPNIFPYNEMLFDGKLKLGGFGVKTRSYDPHIEGPVLLYTSGRIEWHVANRHGYNPRDYTRPAIVGVGDLDHVRELTDKEWNKMRLQFNNVKSLSQINRLNERWVEPLPYGLFFTRLQRFAEPIAFTAAPGPVKKIRVPLEDVIDRLESNGVRVDGDKLIY